MKETGFKKFVKYILFLAVVLCLVFACKSSPSDPKTAPEIDVEREAPAAAEEENEFPPEPDAELTEQEPVLEEKVAEKTGDIQEAESDIPPEVPDETDALLVQKDQEIRDLLNIILDLLQEPPAVPIVPEPQPEKAPEPVIAQAEVPRPIPIPPPPVAPVPPPIIEPLPVEEIREEEPQEEEEIPPEPVRSVVERFVPPSRELPERREDTIVSRIVRAFVGQIIEIPYRGTGWVYLGEMGNRRGIVYDSRRLDITSGVAEGQSFIFFADAAGTYVLKFYKHDFIQDFILNDYVHVIVAEAENYQPGRYAERSRVIAEPRWPESANVTAPPAAQKVQDTPVSPVTVPEPSATARPTQTASPAVTSQQTAPSAAVPQQPASPQTPQESPTNNAATLPAEDALSTESAYSGSDPAEYVRRARQELDAGKVEQALNIMESMLRRFPLGTDEALWLLGQLYEANSPSRDIRLSLSYYRRLVNEYPQSSRVPDAQRRIAYLERYYINIR